MASSILPTLYHRKAKNRVMAVPVEYFPFFKIHPPYNLADAFVKLCGVHARGRDAEFPSSWFCNGFGYKSKISQTTTLVFF